MKKILNFLKCKDKEEVIYKMRSYEGTQEIEELKELIHYISKEGIKRRDLTTIKNKENLLEFLKINLSPRNNEEFKILFLNNANKLIAEKTLFYGTIDKSAVYPRVVLEEVLRYNSAGVILAHNHPSGNLRPSKQDIQLTEALQELLEKINVMVLDHVIIGDDEYFSFKEEGMIENPLRKTPSIKMEKVAEKTKILNTKKGRKIIKRKEKELEL